MIKDGLHDVPKGKVAMVVTHLEMRAPAPVRPVDLPEGITFRQVQPDLAWYRDIFARVGAQDWLWYGRLKLDDAELSAILSDPKIAFYTLTRDGQDHAMLELDFGEDGQCELAYFGLTADLIAALICACRAASETEGTIPACACACLRAAAATTTGFCTAPETASCGGECLSLALDPRCCTAFLPSFKPIAFSACSHSR